MRTLIVMDAKREFQFGHFWRLRLLTTILGVLAVVVYLFFSSYSVALVWIIFLMMLLKGFETMSDVIYGFCLQREKLPFMAASQMMRGLLAALSFAVTLWVYEKLWLAIIISIGFWFAITVIYDFGYVVRALKILEKPRGEAVSFWSANDFWKIIVRGFPLGIASMFVSLNIQIPRYFIKGYFDEKWIGVFSALVARFDWAGWL